MLSIIIPTYNEEKYLPRLLKSIKKQGYKNYEIIVADNNSKDKTREIAKRYDCKIVRGGSPPIARNNGARAAEGGILLFLDADCELDGGFLERSVDQFKKRKLDLATCYFKVKGNRLVDKILLFFGNVILSTTQVIDPHAPGSTIFVTMPIFKQLHGFREDLMQAEDHNFVKRGGKIGKFRILTISNQFNTRRFEKEGRISVLIRYLKSELYRKIKGDITTNIFKYEYGKHGNQKL